MILYFSGTGNSAYVAKRVGKATGDAVVDLFEKIRGRDFSSIHTERPLVVVTPTYAWRLPRIVEDWMERTPFTGNQDVYFILTCGENIGNAGKYLEALCGKKNLKNCGCMGIVMPENYIALFATPSPEEAARTIAQAEPAIQQAIRHIESGTPFPRPKISVLDVLCSGPVSPVQRAGQQPVLPLVRPRQKIPRHQRVHLLRQMCFSLPAQQYSHGERQAGLET